MSTPFIREIRINWDAVPEDSYLRQIPALKYTETVSLRKPVTFLAGENGTGKSTLLEAASVAYGFNPEGGTKNYAFSTHDSHSELWRAVTLVRTPAKAMHGYFLRAESFYNVATAEEEYSKGPGGIPAHYHEKSHGESFLAVTEQHFRGKGMYFLDEPEAALSPQRQLTLLLRINECVKEGAQFVIATHSPILLAYPEAEILNFADRIEPCAYEDTDSYRITRMFVNDRERILHQLFSE